MNNRDDNRAGIFLVVFALVCLFIYGTYSLLQTDESKKIAIPKLKSAIENAERVVTPTEDSDKNSSLNDAIKKAQPTQEDNVTAKETAKSAKEKPDSLEAAIQQATDEMYESDSLKNLRETGNPNVNIEEHKEALALLAEKTNATRYQLIDLVMYEGHYSSGRTVQNIQEVAAIIKDAQGTIASIKLASNGEDIEYGESEYDIDYIEFHHLKEGTQFGKEYFQEGDYCITVKYAEK